MDEDKWIRDNINTDVKSEDVEETDLIPMEEFMKHLPRGLNKEEIKRWKAEDDKLTRERLYGPPNHWMVNALLSLVLLAWLVLAIWSHIWAAEQCRKGIATPPMCFDLGLRNK